MFDTPGSHVTRDYREGTGRLGDLQFRIIDTSGLEPYLPTSTLQVNRTVKSVGEAFARAACLRAARSCGSSTVAAAFSPTRTIHAPVRDASAVTRSAADKPDDAEKRSGAPHAGAVLHLKALFG